MAQTVPFILTNTWLLVADGKPNVFIQRKTNVVDVYVGTAAPAANLPISSSATITSPPDMSLSGLAVGDKVYARARAGETGDILVITAG